MAYYRDPLGRSDVSDEYVEIFEEFDFASFDGECNYFCPECRNMRKCAVYNDFKEGWEFFYS